jgi:L-2,4-diaminobutyric acid acetyltransferase
MFGHRPPVASDCPVVRAIAAQSNGTHTNSARYYLTFFRDFSRTSLVATGDNRPIGFVLGYRRPAEPDDYVIAQHALLPGADTVTARAVLLAAAIRAQVHTGARRAEIAVPDGDRTTAAALERVTEEQGGRAPSATRSPGCSIYVLGPFTSSTN